MIFIGHSTVDVLAIENLHRGVRYFIQLQNKWISSSTTLHALQSLSSNFDPNIFHVQFVTYGH